MSYIRRYLIALFLQRDILYVVIFLYRAYVFLVLPLRS